MLRETLFYELLNRVKDLGLDYYAIETALIPEVDRPLVDAMWDVAKYRYGVGVEMLCNGWRREIVERVMAAGSGKSATFPISEVRYMRYNNSPDGLKDGKKFCNALYKQAKAIAKANKYIKKRQKRVSKCTTGQ